MKQLPTYKETRKRKGKYGKYIDYYVVYNNPNEYLIDNYYLGLNVNTKKYSIDEIIVIKKFDERTSVYLYDKEINPIILRISDYTTYNKGIYMTATIFSIDDACYTIKFYEELNILFEIRKKIVEYLDNLQIVNGDDFLDKCIELGADEKTIFYS